MVAESRNDPAVVEKHERAGGEILTEESADLERRSAGLREPFGAPPETKLLVQDPAAGTLDAAGEGETVLIPVGARGL